MPDVRVGVESIEALHGIVVEFEPPNRGMLSNHLLVDPMPFDR
jgi:hypothetical protein